MKFRTCGAILRLGIFELSQPVECRFVSISDVRHLLESFTTVTTKETVAEMIEAMDLDDLHEMDLEEFVELICTAFRSCAQPSRTEQVNSCLSLTLQAYFLSTKDSAQQVRYCISCSLQKLSSGVVLFLHSGRVLNAYMHSEQHTWPRVRVVLNTQAPRSDLQLSKNLLQ